MNDRKTYDRGSEQIKKMLKDAGIPDNPVKADDIKRRDQLLEGFKKGLDKRSGGR